MNCIAKEKKWHGKRWLLNVISLFCLIWLLPGLAFAVSTAAKLSWDPPSSGTVDGYRIYYGVESKKYDQNFDAGKMLECSLADLSLKDNTTYYFAVRAYNQAGESTDSNEISWTSGDSTPALPPGGLAAEYLGNGEAKISWTANTEVDVNGYNLYYGTTSRQYGPAIPAGASPPYTLDGLKEGQTYFIAVTSIDTSNNESGLSKEISLTIPAPPDQSQPPEDTSSPVITITFPVNDGTYTTKNTSIKLEGTASDDTGVVKVTWTTASGGSGVAYGTENWSIPPVSLDSGENSITIKAYDQAGNEAVKTLVVTYTQPDTTSPVITISPLSSDGSFTSTSSPITLKGTATDDKGVVKVTWSNDRGGSGDASGTESWNISGINLETGDNNITVNAYDQAGNAASKQVTVVLQASQPEPAADEVPPEIAFTAPTNGEKYISWDKNTVDIAGTASDNVGVTKVIWKNRTTGASGTAEGTESWSVQGITLAEGRNIIRVVARDAANNRQAARMVVVYRLDTVKPQLSYTAPTDGGDYTTSNPTVDIAGTASDNVELAKVIWVNKTTGVRGTAQGTQNWSVDGIALQEGQNAIRVVAIDTKDNRRGKLINITYTPRTERRIIIIDKTE